MAPPRWLAIGPHSDQNTAPGREKVAHRAGGAPTESSEPVESQSDLNLASMSLTNLYAPWIRPAQNTAGSGGSS